MKEIVIIASCILAAILVVGILGGLVYAVIVSLAEEHERRHKGDAEYPRLKPGGRRQ